MTSWRQVPVAVCPDTDRRMLDEKGQERRVAN